MPPHGEELDLSASLRWWESVMKDKDSCRKVVFMKETRRSTRCGRDDHPALDELVVRLWAA